MAYFNEFPHTRSYDTDLGWLIEHFKKLFDQVQELEEHVEALQKLYDDVPKRIQDAIDKAIADMTAVLEAELAKMQKALDDQLQYVTDQFNMFRLDFSEIKKIVNEMEQHLADVKALAISYYINGKIYTDTEIAKVYRYIQYELETMVKKWPYIIDPVDGLTEDVQTVVNHMWQKIAPGIRVEVFDAMQIPVEEFDRMMIPVLDFDMYGDTLFGMRRYAYMISPFTGKYVPIADVVNMLYDLHRHGVTVNEFDAAEIPVELFDNAEVEVVTLGTTSKWFEDLKEEMG